MSQTFTSPLGSVVLTAERWRHIVQFHPEVRTLKRQIAEVLDDPETIRRSKFDPTVLICYQRLPDAKYLAVVVKTNQRQFVLTAYLTRRIQHDPA